VQVRFWPVDGSVYVKLRRVLSGVEVNLMVSSVDLVYSRESLRSSALHQRVGHSNSASPHPVDSYYFDLCLRFVLCQPHSLSWAHENMRVGEISLR